MMENNNNISHDGVFALLTYKFGDEIQSDVIYNVCTEFNWNLDDCLHNLTKIQNQPKSGNKVKTESDVDMVVESEEIQNSTGDSATLKELEEGVGNIGVESEKVQLDNQQQYTFAGAIKKANRKSNNYCETVDATVSLSRSKSKARFHDRPQLQEISNQILEGIKVMVILRGAPGSGKSHLSKEIIDGTTCDEYNNHIFSSDDFFYDERGTYNFSAHRLGEVHENNRKRVNQYACSGWSPIIIDNTNMKVWEMRTYFEIAVRCGYMVHILEPSTAWSQAAGKLAMKNSHGVPKETIERMLIGYEPTTVSSAMESFGLNYTMLMPQYRQFPPINAAPNSKQLNNAIMHRFAPKSQRTSSHLPKRNNFDTRSQVPDVVQYESVEDAFRNVDKTTEWTTFDQERTEFWNNNQVQPLQPRQQRAHKRITPDVKSAMVTRNDLHSNLCAILKENNDNIVEIKPSTDEVPKVTLLHKHRKNCKNENDSFAQIRQIFPSVSLDILWDLFEKCEGDGDWTMDILLKDETRIDEYDNVDGNAVGPKNDFECGCDGRNIGKVEMLQSASIEDEISPAIYASTYPRPKRIVINTEEQLATKRMIEQSFQIGDQHYSNHTRKIRNIRRGVVSQAIILDQAPNNEESASAVDVIDTDPNEKEDELLEIDLGIDLVCQLDTVFGVEAYQQDALVNLKTNVFMPKSLAQQLYALWMESMYNQQEELRQKSIKEDADFARQLQSQQNYPGLHKHATPPTDVKDIMEMEYALAAYRTEMDEWKTKTPQDLALQLTHDKLCNTFPNVDRDTLIEVLAAHNNKFNETVDVLKDTLNKAEDKIVSDGRQLLEEVQTEVEMTASGVASGLKRSSRPTSQLSLENRKLGPEEAKRSALQEFEDTRNLAMRHTQLKAECYNKAKEAIQRGNTSVALYYSQVANLHKNKIDTYNHKAANCIMEVHNLTQNNPDMLDLHYLHVNEAAECLDIFLDKHITKLKTKPQTYKYIFVITGRGLHSANGISTIKQKVKNRFRERNLTWSEVNPGLLKVKIFVNSRLTIHL